MGTGMAVGSGMAVKTKLSVGVDYVRVRLGCIVGQCCVQLSSDNEVISGDVCDKDFETFENMLSTQVVLHKSTQLGSRKASFVAL